MGFSELKSASCVFIKWFSTDVFVLVLVYVDHILMLSPSSVQWEEVYQAIASLYEIRRTKEVNLYLGVELRWNKCLGDAMMLHMLQPTYIKSMLVRYGMQDSRPASTPMLEWFSAHLEAEEDMTVVELNLYQQIIDSLLFLPLRSDQIF
jgi:Reverse transcriptase (RNA-dependent DNA polymerase)